MKKNKYLLKIAAIKDSAPDNGLRPHQVRALVKLDKNKGVVLDHSTGSGKTLTFLKAVEKSHIENPTNRALIMSPASLTTNVDKEISKHNLSIDKTRLDVLSYEKAVNESDRLKKNKYAIVIADEAHRLRNTGTKRHASLSEIISSADKRLLATGTTTYNHVSDVAPLVNIAAGKEVLPSGKKEFEAKYVKKHLEQPPLLKRILGAHPIEKSNLVNKGDLAKKIRPFMDKYDIADDPKAKNDFPQKIEKVIEIPMSSEQHTLYRYMEGKLPFHLRLKVRMNVPLDGKETSQLNAFASAIRQVSNSPRSFMPNNKRTSPKIEKATESLARSYLSDKNFRGLVYSNYLQSGVGEYSRELQKYQVPHNIYHGGLSKSEKDRMVKEYNEGTVPVLLVSSSGAEGLDLKGTKKVQVLEPHFNDSKIKQVIGRGSRYKSHSHLPEEERQVEIEHYLSTMPKGIFGKPKTHSIDQYLYHNSKHKQSLGDELAGLIKEKQED